MSAIVEIAAPLRHEIPRDDPEKCEAVFPLDISGTRLRGDHAQTRSQSAMPLHPEFIAL